MKIHDHYDFILVGGGPSSRILNKYLHLLMPKVSTLVVRDEKRIVNHCGTPYIVEGHIPWEKGLIKEELVTKFGTQILVDPVVDGDGAEKFVITESGRKIGYDKLVFATGTDQALPPIPGIDSERVLKVRRTEDVERAIPIIHEVERITVLGGGYIGLEFATCLKKMGKQVTLVEMMDHVMGGRTDEAMAQAVEEHLKSLGIKVLTKTKAINFKEVGNACLLEIDGRDAIETDVLLPAAGVKPLISYAQAFGLETGKEGILVDEFFKTNITDIYALGDCIVTKSRITGEPVPGKLGSNAGQMARYLALNFTGEAKSYPGVINAALTMLEGLAYGSAGLTEKDASEAGIPVETCRNTSSTYYENMPGSGPVDIKLIYRKEDLTLIGGELMARSNISGFIELLARLIEDKATLKEVITMSYSSHPELTPKTSKPFFVWASEGLLAKL